MSRVGGAVYLAGVLAVCCLIEYWSLQLGDRTLSVPMNYDGDAIFHATCVKGLVENGWYQTNPSLAAPFGFDLYDFPQPESLHYALLKVLSWAFSGYVAVFNLFFLLTFPLTVLASIATLREFSLSRGSACVAGLLYAFLPYHMCRGEGHYMLSAYYMVPPTVMVALWVARGDPLFARTTGRARTCAAIVICVLAGSAGVYYAFFGGFVLVVAGGVGSWTGRSFRPVLRSFVLALALFLSLVANLSPTLLNNWRCGSNLAQIERLTAEAELYGLKVTQMLLPVQWHRIGWLADVRRRYDASAPLVNENGAATLGVVAGLGFLALIGLLFLPGEVDGERWTLLVQLSRLNIALVLLGTVGGFSSLFAQLYPQIRAYNRCSIYIAFFSLMAFFLLLEECLDRFRWLAASRVVNVVFVLIGTVGILDVLRPGLGPDRVKTAEAFEHDRRFVERIEAAVPRGAAIFQLPVMTYPRHRPASHLGEWLHFRPYLHSRTLRWSYPSAAGRIGGKWQERVDSLPVPDKLDTLTVAGFAGVYVNRDGYEDGGKALEGQLASVLGVSPLVSENGRLAFFDMAGYSAAFRKRHGTPDLLRKRERELAPMAFSWLGGFSDLERGGGDEWRWCSSRGTLLIVNTLPRARRVLLAMWLQTGWPRASDLVVEGPSFSQTVAVSSARARFERTLLIPIGETRISFSCDERRVDAPADPRTMVFRVLDFSVEEE